MSDEVENNYSFSLKDPKHCFQLVQYRKELDSFFSAEPTYCLNEEVIKHIVHLVSRLNLHEDIKIFYDIFNTRCFELFTAISRFDPTFPLKIGDELHFKEKDMRNYDKLSDGNLFGFMRIKHRDTNKKYLLKVINKITISELRCAEQLRAEYKASTSCHHLLHNIVYSYNNVTNLCWLYEDSQHSVVSLLSPKGRLPLEQIRYYIPQLVVAVQKLHEMNIVHRNIQPEIILLNSHRNIKLSGFECAGTLNNGINIITQRDRITENEFSAPELLQGLNDLHKFKTTWAVVSLDCDLWSLGVVIHSFLLGYLPFDKWDEESLVHYESLISAFQEDVSSSWLHQEFCQLLCGLIAKPGGRLEGERLKSISLFCEVKWDNVGHSPAQFFDNLRVLEPTVLSSPISLPEYDICEQEERLNLMFNFLGYSYDRRRSLTFTTCQFDIEDDFDAFLSCLDTLVSSFEKYMVPLFQFIVGPNAPPQFFCALNVGQSDNLRNGLLTEIVTVLRRLFCCLKFAAVCLEVINDLSLNVNIKAVKVAINILVFLLKSLQIKIAGMFRKNDEVKKKCEDTFDHTLQNTYTITSERNTCEGFLDRIVRNYFSLALNVLSIYSRWIQNIVVPHDLKKDKRDVFEISDYMAYLIRNIISEVSGQSYIKSPQQVAAKFLDWRLNALRDFSTEISIMKDFDGKFADEIQVVITQYEVVSKKIQQSHQERFFIKCSDSSSTDNCEVEPSSSGNKRDSSELEHQNKTKVGLSTVLDTKNSSSKMKDNGNSTKPVFPIQVQFDEQTDIKKKAAPSAVENEAQKYEIWEIDPIEICRIKELVKKMLDKYNMETLRPAKSKNEAQRYRIVCCRGTNTELPYYSGRRSANTGSHGTNIELTNTNEFNTIDKRSDSKPVTPIEQLEVKKKAASSEVKTKAQEYKTREMDTTNPDLFKDENQVTKTLRPSTFENVPAGCQIRWSRSADIELSNAGKPATNSELPNGYVVTNEDAVQMDARSDAIMAVPSGLQFEKPSVKKEVAAVSPTAVKNDAKKHQIRGSAGKNTEVPIKNVVDCRSNTKPVISCDQQFGKHNVKEVAAIVSPSAFENEAENYQSRWGVSKNTKVSTEDVAKRVGNKSDTKPTIPGDLHLKNQGCTKEDAVLRPSAFRNEIKSYIERNQMMTELADEVKIISTTINDPEAIVRLQNVGKHANMVASLTDFNLKLVFPYKQYDVVKELKIKTIDKQPRTKQVHMRVFSSPYNNENISSEDAAIESNKNAYWERIMDPNLRHRLIAPLTQSDIAFCSACRIIILKNENRFRCVRCSVMLHEECISKRMFCKNNILGNLSTSKNCRDSARCWSGFLQIIGQRQYKHLLFFCTYENETLTLYNPVEHVGLNPVKSLLDEWRKMESYRIKICPNTSDRCSLQIKFYDSHNLIKSYFLKAASVLEKNILYYNLAKTLTDDIKGPFPVSPGPMDGVANSMEQIIGESFYGDDIRDIGSSPVQVFDITVLEPNVFLLSTRHGFLLYHIGKEDVYIVMRHVKSVRKFIYLPSPYEHSYAIAEFDRKCLKLIAMKSQDVLSLTEQQPEDHSFLRLEYKRYFSCSAKKCFNFRDIILSHDRRYLAALLNDGVMVLKLNGVGAFETCSLSSFNGARIHMMAILGNGDQQLLVCFVNDAFYKILLDGNYKTSGASFLLRSYRMASCITEEFLHFREAFLKIQLLRPGVFMIVVNHKVFFLKNEVRPNYAYLAINPSEKLVDVGVFGETIRVVTVSQIMYFNLYLTMASDYIDEKNRPKGFQDRVLDVYSRALCHEIVRPTSNIIGSDDPFLEDFLLTSINVNLHESKCRISILFNKEILRHIRSILYSYPEVKYVFKS